jgi:hypothetical protein
LLRVGDWGVLEATSYKSSLLIQVNWLRLSWRYFLDGREVTHLNDISSRESLPVELYYPFGKRAWITAAEGVHDLSVGCAIHIDFYGKPQAKLAASSVLLVLLYLATCGNRSSGHSGWVQGE